jgi:hypothetical protein
MASFRSSLLHLKKPSDVSDALLCHLNIHLEKDVPFESFIPAGQFEKAPFLFNDDLNVILAELENENEDAYREIMRLPPFDGRKKPKLTYSRAFFAGLEDMRRYYDESQDSYREIDGDEAEENESGEKLGSVQGELLPTRLTGKAQPRSSPAEPPSQLDKDGDSRMVNSKPKPDQSAGEKQNENSLESEKLSPSTSPGSKKTMYKGLRIGNSSSVPPGTRTSMVRNLVKMVTHKFSCRDYDLSSKERLRITDVNLPPVPSLPNFVIVKTPADMKLARSRFVEGPLMSISIRHDFAFAELKREEGTEGAAQQREISHGQTSIPMGSFSGDRRAPSSAVLPPMGAAYDFSRELACMLCVAIQRNRENKGSKEAAFSREKENWWWAEAVRWGNGPTKWGQLASEVFEEDDPSWSPEERRLQELKRSDSEEDTKILPPESVNGRNIQIEDLMADRKERLDNFTIESGGITERRSERRPPKKKNRMDLNSSEPENIDQSEERTVEINPENPGSKRKDSGVEIRANGRPTKQRAQKVEFRDGRRVMS